MGTEVLGLFPLPPPSTLYMTCMCSDTQAAQIHGEWDRQMQTAPTMRIGTKWHKETVTTRGAPSDSVVTELGILSMPG